MTYLCVRLPKENESRNLFKTFYLLIYAKWTEVRIKLVGQSTQMEISKHVSGPNAMKY